MGQIAGMYGGDYDTITATWNLTRDKLEALPDSNGQRRHYLPCAYRCGKLVPAPWKKDSVFCDNCIAATEKAKKKEPTNV